MRATYLPWLTQLRHIRRLTCAPTDSLNHSDSDPKSLLCNNFHQFMISFTSHGGCRFRGRRLINYRSAVYSWQTTLWSVTDIEIASETLKCLSHSDFRNTPDMLHRLRLPSNVLADTNAVEAAIPVRQAEICAPPVIGRHDCVGRRRCHDERSSAGRDTVPIQLFRALYTDYSAPQTEPAAIEPPTSTCIASHRYRR